MDKQRVEFSGYYAEREGSTITFGHTRSHVFRYDFPSLIIQVKVDGSIELDPDFANGKQKLIKNAKEWESFLRWIGFPENLARHTLGKRPPPQLKTPEDGWEYLRGIALGQTKVRLCGPKCRDSVKAFLEEHGQLPPNEES